MRKAILYAIGLFVFFLSGCETEQNQPSKTKVEEALARNKALVRRQHEDVWSKGNLAATEEVYASDFVCHFIVGPEWKGREGVMKVITEHRAAFPDWNEQIDDIIAEEDKVVTRFTSRGTHMGEFQGIAATGKKVTITEVAIYRIADGKIVEQWGFPDILSLLQQLGAAPPAKPGGK